MTNNEEKLQSDHRHEKNLASIFEIFIVWVGTQESLLKFLQFCDILANTFQLDAKFTASFSKASIEF